MRVGWHIIIKYFKNPEKDISTTAEKIPPF